MFALGNNPVATAGALILVGVALVGVGILWFAWQIDTYRVTRRVQRMEFQPEISGPFDDSAPSPTLCEWCGTDCDGSDAVLLYDFIPLCGSFYGNGCADDPSVIEHFREEIEFYA